MGLLKELGGCKRSPGDGMVERLGLRLRRRRGSEGGSGLSDVGCFRQECDLIGDATTEIAKGLADVGRVVVRFVVVLFATIVRL